MAVLFRQLWAGEVSLARTFWEFSVVYGLVLNVAATVASLGMAAAGHSGWLALMVHFLPVPYVILALVAVWRSAARYPGRKLWADLARALAVPWTLLLIVA